MADLTSTSPSVGYSLATDIREAADGDFLLIVADANADGTRVMPGAAGALAVFNRSIGTFEQGRADVGYLQAMRIVGDPNATGRMGAAAGYRRPVSLPDGRIMAAFTANNGQSFEIHAVDPRTNASTPLFTNNGRSRFDAVLALRHPPRALYDNRRQLVFGGAADLDRGTSVLYMPDAPMVFTLLVANLRRGRPLAEFDRATTLAIYRENPCGASCSPNTGSGIFESRELLGIVPLAGDGSVKVQLPSATGVVLELRDGSGAVVARMGEEHQMGPGERVAMGVSRTLFDGVCGGCHGSISGRELDVSVTPDALTGASASASEDASPATPR
jgi:hypothetical protein